MFPNNKSFRSQSFVLSAPEINIFPTALTMLTRSSVQFLFDSCLIPVQSLSKSRRIFCLPPVTPPCYPPYFLLNFLPQTLLFLPFSANPLFPLPDKFPLYNIIMCIFPSPAFPFSIINYQNRPLPQPFTFLFKIFSKKSPFIFVSYLLMPYFCIRFPRDGQHLILTCCNGVGPALQNNKNNFLFIWIIIIKVVIFAVRFAERGSLSDTSFPFAQRGLEIKDGH